MADAHRPETLASLSGLTYNDLSYGSLPEISIQSFAADSEITSDSRFLLSGRNPLP